MSYNVIINEAQRSLLAAVLGEACGAQCLPEGYDAEEASILVSMLEELPQAEDETPGCLHRLCL